MHSRLRRVRTVREVAALALVVVAAATVLPEAGWNATAHYALVESLADGTPRIDGHLNQGGDVAWVDGHFYAAKSPGLAFASLPLYVTLDAVGAVPTKEVATQGPPGARGVRKEAVWQLNLVVVAAFFGLLLLMRYAANACAPGTGLAVAVILGLGTMLLPFSTAYFAHVLSATLGFAAFALVLGRRDSRLAVAGAGVLAGLAVVTEASLALVAVALAAWVLVDRQRLQRGGLYVAGLVAGSIPLLAYNAWAFGSPFRNGYSDAVAVLGATGHDVVGANDVGFFGLTYPRPHYALDLLFDSQRGLFVLTPVVAVAVAGLLPLWRRGSRREAIFVGSLAFAFLLYNAAYWIPFGGDTPGTSLPRAAAALPRLAARRRLRGVEVGHARDGSDIGVLDDRRDAWRRPHIGGRVADDLGLGGDSGGQPGRFGGRSQTDSGACVRAAGSSRTAARSAGPRPPRRSESPGACATAQRPARGLVVLPTDS